MIDAHQHFWQLDKPFDYDWLKAPQHAPINRNFLPSDLRPHLDATGMAESIFVQTQHDLEETRWVLGMTEEYDWLVGVVGWVDLASEACEEQLLELKEHLKFVGIRHITQDEPDDDFIVRPEILRGLKVLEKHGVPFDLLFYVKHLKHADQLGRELPELPMVIDHLAKPRIKDQSVDDWLPQLKAAAQLPIALADGAVGIPGFPGFHLARAVNNGDVALFTARFRDGTKRGFSSDDHLVVPAAGKVVVAAGGQAQQVEEILIRIQPLAAKPLVGR